MMNPPPQYPYQPPPQPQKSNTGLIIGCAVGGFLLLFVCGGIGTALMLGKRAASHAAAFGTTYSTTTAATTVAPATTNAPYVDAAGKYEVTFPSGTPTTDTRVDPSAVGPVTTHLALVTAGGVTYIAGWSDFPFKPADQDATLDGAVNGATKAGTLLTSGKVTASGLHGREFTARLSASGITMRSTGRTFLDGKRLYQLNALVPEADFTTHEPEMQAFLKTFKLVP